MSSNREAEFELQGIVLVGMAVAAVLVPAGVWAAAVVWYDPDLWFIATWISITGVLAVVSYWLRVAWPVCLGAHLLWKVYASCLVIASLGTVVPYVFSWVPLACADVLMTLLMLGNRGYAPRWIRAILYAILQAVALGYAAFLVAPQLTSFSAGAELVLYRALLVGVACAITNAELTEEPYRGLSGELQP